MLSPTHPNRTVLPPEGPHPNPSPVSQNPAGREKRTREPGPRKQARRKTETNTRAEAGKKCMPGRRAGQQRVEETVNGDETTKETGGSQQPSEGRARGRGHGKHTTSTTPQQSTREGGPGNRRRAAPRTMARTAETPHTPHTPTPAPTARGQRARAARPEGGQPGKGGHLNPDAPHHPCGAQPLTGHASHGDSAAPPHPHTRAHSVWVADLTARPEGGQPGEGEGLTPDSPHSGERHPPGDALPPPPQRATTAGKGARCGAGAGSPRPHQPHPGHTARGTPAARPRGRAVGGGTAPDTRRPSQRWKATPPGDDPCHPRGTQPPTGHAS